jgi:hypothetical protein
MKLRHRIIICLAIIGLIFSGLVEGVIIPRDKEIQQQYIIEQQDPTTHDLNSILKYKNKYMGNASNLLNLFRNLPLSNVPRTFELFPENLTLVVNYKVTVENTSENKVQKALIYDSIAAFALIDNLEGINYNFQGTSYKVLRSDIKKLYDMELSSLLNKEEWKSKVQNRLEDQAYINNCFKNFTINVAT